MLAGLIQRKPPEGLAAKLMLTDPLPASPRAQALTFSGGVSEYIFQREESDFGDLGQPFAKAIRNALNRNTFGLPAIIDPNLGIRATAVGASQFNVQGGVNAYVSDESILPLLNVPVLVPRIELAGDVHGRRDRRVDPRCADPGRPDEGEQPIALTFEVPGRRCARAAGAGAGGGHPRRPADARRPARRHWCSSSTRASRTCS